MYTLNFSNVIILSMNLSDACFVMQVAPRIFSSYKPEIQSCSICEDIMLGKAVHSQNRFCMFSFIWPPQV